MKQNKFNRCLCLMLFPLFLLNIGCNQKDVTAGEDSPKQVITTKKAASGKDLIVEVNGVKLTSDELEAELSSKLAPVIKQIPKEQLEQFRAQMHDRFIDDFITRTILEQEAKKQNISIDDSEIDLKLDEIKKSLPEGMTLENALKVNGMTIDAMKKNIVLGLKASKLIDSQVKSDSTPSEQEIKEYYDKNSKKFDTPESVHARHILIKTDTTDNETVKSGKKAKIELLREKLVKGADFEKTAKENSDCPSKTKGGDLGTFSRGNMVKPFEDAAFSQKTNETGPVIETRFGYHIIQVLEHNAPVSKTLKDAKSTIEDTLKQQKKQAAVKEYITQLRQKATIVYGNKTKK